MIRKLLMPKLGLTMTEGVIAEWSVQVGTPFKTDDTLFVVETDKVANEIPAEADGVLHEISVEAGQNVAVGEVIGYWDDGAGETAEPVHTPSASIALSTVPASAPADKTARESEKASAPGTQCAQGAQCTPVGQRIRATPLARRIARMENVDLAQVRGSGPRNAVRAQDVREMAQRNSGAPAAALMPNQDTSGATRHKPTPVNSAMARRLSAAKQQVPHFYLAVEAELSKLLALRSEINALNPANPAVRITINHFVVAAVGRALADLPELNAVWDEGEIVRYRTTDVGVAVNSDKGLFVPVVRDIGTRTLYDIAAQTSRLIERARTGALTAQEMQGGAITVSNAGMFNVKFMTPIINPGQAMILGVGSISEQFRPDANGKPKLTREIGLVLAGDHRLLDGVSGLKFLNRVTAYLEQPLQLLLGQSFAGATP